MKNLSLKKILMLIVLVVIGLSLVGCGETVTNNVSNNSSNRPSRPAKVEEKIDYIGELRVLNAAEYMDMGTVKDFEREYKIHVIYDEFESNESMYEDIVSNPNSYDVLVPSDYMIDRLIKENRLEKINKANIPNISNIATEYLNPEYDKNNDYIVPYMTGTLGIL